MENSHLKQSNMCYHGDKLRVQWPPILESQELLAAGSD